jgi:polyhydroxybutyrate depolymerase
MRPTVVVPLLMSLAGCATQEPWPAEVGSVDRCAAGGLPPGPSVIRFQHQGRTRGALVWAPQKAGPHDVVINLHEFRSDPERQAHYSGWVPLVEEANVIMVTPDGRAATWNAGICCGKAKEERSDDVTFLDEVLKRIEATGCTSGRVLATGIGNGGMMAERWACESDGPDAVVSVGGSLQIDACPKQKKIPVLHYHGTGDKFIPADGSGHHMPVSHALSAWKARNQAVAPMAAGEGDLICEGWTGGASVLSCTVAGMEDLWPGSPHAKIKTTSPLGDAAKGGLEWVRGQWSTSSPQ